MNKRNKKYGLFLLFFALICNQHIYSQALKKFKELGFAEKVWAITHPFVAKKALKISVSANRISQLDSIQKKLGMDANGGLLDAFRHAYWMAKLSQEIGNKKALKLGEAHEKKNYRDFKRKRLEEGFIPDKASQQMDLKNNRVAIKLTNKKNKLTDDEIIREVLFAIKNGQLSMIKKNENKISLDKWGNIIPQDKWEGKWENDRLIVPTETF